MDATQIQSLIEEFLNHLCVSFDTIVVEQRDQKGKIRFVVESGDSHLLIGTGGEHLQALNMLVRHIARRGALEGESIDFTVDVNNYYGRRIEELEEAARRLGERAKFFKRDVEMAPASSYERMIVHSCLADDPEIATESQGEGKFRRVVVKYTDNASV